MILDVADNKNPADSNGYTLLHEASRKGYNDIFRMIIDAVSEKNPMDVYGNTPFHCAAESGSDDICRIIIANIKERNPVTNDLKWTPLHFAASCNKDTTFKIIFDATEDKNPTDRNGKTPLNIAYKQQNVEICKIILEQKEESFVKGFLVGVVKRNCTSMLRTIIDFFNDEIFQNDYGKILLDTAAEEGNQVICKMILNKIYGKEPFHIAALKGNTNIFRITSKVGFLNINP